MPIPGVNTVLDYLATFLVWSPSYMYTVYLQDERITSLAANI